MKAIQPNNAPDPEAIDWLIRLTGNRPEAVPQQLKDEFKQWATQSVEHLRSFMDLASIYYALGECESELIGELVAEIDEKDNIIVSLGPPRIIPV